MMRSLSKHFVLLALVVSIAGPTACGNANDGSPSSVRPAVFVSIEPLRYFAEHIGGDAVDVYVLVSPGQSPATYEPTARQITQLAGAQLFFVIGVPMEQQLLPRIRRSFPGVNIIDTRAGIEPASWGRSAAAQTRVHSEFDPHIWLDPGRARQIAKTIYQALAKILPEHQADLLRRYRSLDEELAQLDIEIASILEPVRGKEMVVFHPAFGYFAEAFGLKQWAIESGGVTPGSRHLAEIIELARERGVKAIFVQPQFSSATAAAVAAEIGAELVTLDPLAADYTANMRKMARSILDALSKG